MSTRTFKFKVNVVSTIKTASLSTSDTVLLPTTEA